MIDGPDLLGIDTLSQMLYQGVLMVVSSPISLTLKDLGSFRFVVLRDRLLVKLHVQVQPQFGVLLEHFTSLLCGALLSNLAVYLPLEESL